MAIFRFTLSIGFHGADYDEEMEIEDEILNECKNESEREDLIQIYWKEWANGYIEGGAKEIK